VVLSLLGNLQPKYGLAVVADKALIDQSFLVVDRFDLLHALGAFDADLTGFGLWNSLPVDHIVGLEDQFACVFYLQTSWKCSVELKKAVCEML
jgi:hypothetical protein